jgi:hypothetical protein
MTDICFMDAHGRRWMTYLTLRCPACNTQAPHWIRSDGEQILCDTCYHTERIGARDYIERIS